MNKLNRVNYKIIKEPKLDCTNKPVMLSDETMKQRFQNVIHKMKEKDIDTLVVYADLEHGSNFEYLTGFLPRFEEALLVVHQSGKSFMLMGNENLNKVSKARLNAEAIHVPHFSLPNQPMGKNKSIKELLSHAGIMKDSKVGIAGWKKFTSVSENNEQLYDVPYFIIKAIIDLVGDEKKISNAINIFIGDGGVRCKNNVNEIEHYEFGASLASDCMLKTMNKIDLGISELVLGDTLNAFGQRNSVVTIAASGPRFLNANIYPTDKCIADGETISMTVGYKGGLSSRAGYIVNDEQSLPDNCKDYLDVLVKPYYNAIAVWLENIHCGMVGKDLYQLIEDVLPKSKYNWTLCPGHLGADEEWLSSPIYEKSEEQIVSGMIFQTDIIPSLSGYAGTSVESTILVADQKLQDEIKNACPEMWARMMQRKEYIENELNIQLNKDVLPMCSTVAYLRPFLLNKEKAMSL
ncbi:MAG: aminopeptidase P family N-terminal domain-containing protein [Anaerorhabdus sp.]